MSIVRKRLREARLEAQLTQEKLGVLAGIEEMTANSRMNHYETGRSALKIIVLKQIAKVLGLPLSYFYSEDDDEAYLVKTFFRMTRQQKKEALEFFKSKQPPGNA